MDLQQSDYQRGVTSSCSQEEPGLPTSLSIETAVKNRLHDLLRLSWVYHAALYKQEEAGKANWTPFDRIFDQVLDFALAYKLAIKSEDCANFAALNLHHMPVLLDNLDSQCKLLGVRPSWLFFECSSVQQHEYMTELLASFENKFRVLQPSIATKVYPILVGNTDAVEELKLLLHSMRLNSFDPLHEWEMRVLGVKGWPHDILNRITRTLQGMSDQQQLSWIQIDLSELRMDLNEANDEADDLNIGSGAYSVVRLAEFRGSTVAVKLYNAEVTEESFKKEITIWAPFKDANVIELIGASKLTRPFFAIMPSYNGGNIREYLDCRVTSAADLLNLSFDVASGLRYLHHSMNICHGDLKGDNVVVDTNGKACIIDFGTSASLIGDTWLQSTTVPKARRGTVRWMSQKRLLDGQLSHDDDVYALGMTIWEIWTYFLPFHNVCEFAIKRVVLSGARIERPSIPSIDDPVWQLMNMCWESPNTHFTADKAHSYLQALREQFTEGAVTLHANEHHNSAVRKYNNIFEASGR